MKRSIYILIAAAAAFLTACSNKEIQVSESVISFSDSLSSVNAQMSIFTSSDKTLTASLNKLNEKISSIYDKEYDALQSSVEQDASLPDSNIIYELFMGDSVFCASPTLVSVQICTYFYSGGAHGTTSYRAVNFNPRVGLFMSVEDIFDMRSVESINAILQSHFDNSSGCFWENPTLEKASAVNINFSELTFTYDQYLLGPYACGPAVVRVPLGDIEQYMLIIDNW